MCDRIKIWLVPFLALVFAIGTPPQSLVAASSDSGGCHEMAMHQTGMQAAAVPGLPRLQIDASMQGCGMDHTGVQPETMQAPMPDVLPVTWLPVEVLAIIASQSFLLLDHPPPRFAASARTHLLVATFLL